MLLNAGNVLVCIDQLVASGRIMPAGRVMELAAITVYFHSVAKSAATRPATTASSSSTKSFRLSAIRPRPLNRAPVGSYDSMM